ncbi:glycosyltransferase family 2 protein [Pseudomonas viridiflava]|nr:glycosyltransferase family 2 protein [Pseudomonas viridiflava]
MMITSDPRETGRPLNILILAGGDSNSNIDDGNYPLCLADVGGITLIEHLLQACARIGATKVVACFRKSDIEEFHLESIMRVLAPGANVVSANKDVAGAACTALLAIGHIENDDELLILNGNELIDVDYLTIVTSFRERKLSAGTVTFPSIHPRYSYVRISDEGLVIEAVEKRTISRHATAGFYWFAHGKDFVRCAQNMIRKDASVNGKFYVCPVLNELVLEQHRVGVFAIDASLYRPLKTVRQVMRENPQLKKRT